MKATLLTAARATSCTVELAQIITEVPRDMFDPVAIVAPPFGRTILVASGEGNAHYIFDHDPDNAAEPFSLRGELAYSGRRPQLPSGATMMNRGSAQGLVPMTELSEVRSIRFEEDGDVTDLGVYALSRCSPWASPSCHTRARTVPHAGSLPGSDPPKGGMTIRLPPGVLPLLGVCCSV